MSTKTPSRKPIRRAKAPPVAAQRTPKGRACTKARTKGKGTSARPLDKTKAAAPAGVAAPPSSKRGRLISLLRSPQGGTLAQMMALTGWQAHSVRGTLSGVLRKKLGLKVLCEVGGDDGTRIYRIGATRAAT